jgi:molybdopterin synthase catalytic subunit
MAIDYLIEGPVTSEIITLVIESTGRRNDTGGHSIFLGQVRADEINGKCVTAIEYSAYASMVKAEADKIKEIILSEFSDAKIVEIVHSTGIVKAGEVSLLVMVSAGHRHHATEACSKTVELVKERLPVWKKEIFDDDSHSWKENH